MTTWVPQKSDTLQQLADEIVHNYGSGRAFVGVDGLGDSGQAAFADDLADALRAGGRTVERAGLDDFADDDAFRQARVIPFRAARAEGAALLVVDGALDGHADLLPALNYTVWVEGPSPAGKGYEARFRTDAVFDNADPAHPRRLFDDAC